MRGRKRWCGRRNAVPKGIARAWARRQKERAPSMREGTGGAREWGALSFAACGRRGVGR